jgi:hypothetical protein
MTTRLPFAPHAAARLALVLVLAASTSALAVPQIESTYGGQSPWYSGEINALGGTGGALGRGAMANVLNPAGLALVDGLRVDVGIAAAYHEEDRFMPVFDSFESYVTDMAIASNQSTWLGTGFGATVRVLEGEVPLTAGVSLVERYPYRYRFEEEIRDPSPFSDPRDRIQEERTYEVTGALRTLSLGFGVEDLERRIAVGAAVHYAFGEREESWLLRDRDLADGDESFDTRNTWDLGGVHATIGIQGELIPRVRVGVAYETSLEVDGDYTITTFAAGDTTAVSATSSESITYPAAWRFAAAFFPRSDPRTVVTFDFVYTDWGELEDSRGYPGVLHDVHDARVGLEHTFYNDFQLRFGFRHYGSYADDEGGNSVFSGGAGFPVANGTFSVSLELNKLSSFEPHIFPYPEGYVADEIARVDDLRTRLGIGWSRQF